MIFKTQFDCSKDRIISKILSFSEQNLSRNVFLNNNNSSSNSKNNSYNNNNNKEKSNRREESLN